jgi:hypothetical protein
MEQCGFDVFIGVYRGLLHVHRVVPWESWSIRSPHTRKILGSNPSGTIRLFNFLVGVFYFLKKGKLKVWEGTSAQFYRNSGGHIRTFLL